MPPEVVSLQKRDGPPPLPPRPGSSQVVPARPRGLVWPRVASLWPSFPFLPHTDGNGNGNGTNGLRPDEAGNETETKQATPGRNGTAERWQQRNGTERRNGTANGRTKPETSNGRKPGKEGTAHYLPFPSFLPAFPFFVPFPFLYARKKNYFSAFTLCFATFRKKSKKKFVK